MMMVCCDNQGGQLFVKWFGTHEEYNSIDPATISRRR
jgi:hypothetical protein